MTPKVRTKTTLLEEIEGYKREVEEAKERKQFEFVFLLLDKIENLEQNLKAYV